MLRNLLSVSCGVSLRPQVQIASEAALQASCACCMHAQVHGGMLLVMTQAVFCCFPTSHLPCHAMHVRRMQTHILHSAAQRFLARRPSARSSLSAVVHAHVDVPSFSIGNISFLPSIFPVLCSHFVVVQVIDIVSRQCRQDYLKSQAIEPKYQDDPCHVPSKPTP